MSNAAKNYIIPVLAIGMILTGMVIKANPDVITFPPGTTYRTTFNVKGLEWIGDVRWLGQISYTRRRTESEKSASESEFNHRQTALGNTLVGEDGKPYVYKSPEYDMTFSKDIELGLREDGVVVWRKVKQ